MDSFTEEHSQLLLAKEWLVKNKDSAIYLFKCHFSSVDASCFIMISDTKTVWTEVLNGRQFARRWRSCNDNAPEFDRDDEEAEWRISNLELLSKAHSLDGISELSFDCVESNYSDFAFELECDAFKWRWETCLLGSRLSSEMISKHLVLPLISLNHLGFSSAVHDCSESDLEKAVDKVGRTARRTVDTHIKNAMAKPRMATALRRITAMFNFLPDLPPIQLNAEKAAELELRVPAARPAVREPSPAATKRQIPAPAPDPIPTSSPISAAAPAKASGRPTQSRQDSPVNMDSDSATEPDSDDEAPATEGKGASAVSPPPAQSRDDSAVPSKPSRKAQTPSSDSETSPARPAKKAKAAPSTSDSEVDGKPIKTAKRGTRQPLKRGGKRF